MSTLPPDSEHARTPRPAPQLRPEPVRRGPHIEVVAPAVEAPKHPSRQSTEREVKAAVESARAAQESWRRMSLDERVAALTRAAKEMLRRRSEVIALVADGDGQGRRRGPLQRGARAARHGQRLGQRGRARRAPASGCASTRSASPEARARGPGPARRGGRHRAVELSRRRGSIARSSPRCSPATPWCSSQSEYTPRTSAWLARAARGRAARGADRRCSRRRRVGAALIDAGIDACVFTGSPQTGRKVRRALRRARHSVERGDGRQGRRPSCSATAICRAPWPASPTGRSPTPARPAAPSRSRTSTSHRRRVRRRACAARGRASGGRRATPTSRRSPTAASSTWWSSQVEDARAKGAAVVCGGAPTGDGCSATRRRCSTAAPSA